MKILNLSKNFKFTQPTINHKSFTFPSGKEDHIIIDKKDHPDIKSASKIVIASDLDNPMKLFLATDALRRLNKKCDIELFAPYFSYGRQDRPMVEGEPFSLKVFASQINSQGYNNVHVLDPHSDVTSALVDNIKIIDNTKYVEKVWLDIISKEQADVCIVSPDAGAEKKINKMAKNLNLLPHQIIKGSKSRNVATGRLSDSDFIGDANDKACVIFDDICDGGATFINLADKLKMAGAKNIYLAVSHGIFSKGFDSLFNIIKGIYTTDSVGLVSHHKSVKVIPINEFYSVE